MGAMAGDARHGAGRLADRLTPTATQGGGIQLFYCEQYSVGGLGVHTHAYALIVLQFCLCAMNLRGFKKNTE